MKQIYKYVFVFLAVLLLGLLSLYLLAASLVKPMSSDENMYCTGGYLLSKGEIIYRDFSYVAQLPYHPLLCAAVFKFTGTNHYLLAARLISVSFDILIVLAIFSIIRKIFEEFYFSGILMGLAGAAIFVFNPYSAYLCGVAWNHDMVLFCIMMSLYLLLDIVPITLTESSPGGDNMEILNGHTALAESSMGAGTKQKRIFIMASLLTIAVWTRITSVFFMPIFLGIIIFNCIRQHLPGIYIWGSIISFVFGMIVFSIWPLLIILNNADASFVNLIKMPILNSQLLHHLGIAYSKSYLTMMAIRNYEFLFLILITLFVCGCVILLRKRIALLFLMLLIVSIIVAYFPPTMWKQYFGIPVVFMIFVSAYGIMLLRKSESQIHFRIFVFLFLVLAIETAIMAKPQIKILKFMSVKNWTPMKVHQVSENIVARAGSSKRILTLTPLYVIEGGGDFYNKLSAGVFAFRVADKLSESERQISHTAGLKEFPDILAKDQPEMVVIGAELTRFEKIDLKSLVPINWVRFDCGDDGVHCFVPDTD